MRQANLRHKRKLALALLLTLPFLLTACPSFVTKPPTLSINSFIASPTSLPAGGGSVTLNWEVSNADTLAIDQGIGTVTGNSKTVAVTTTTRFTLTASKDTEQTSKNVAVTVQSSTTDTTAPTIISIVPVNGATGVSNDSSIVITFSEKMNQEATQAAYQSASLTSNEVTFTWNTEGTVFTIKPNLPLISNLGNDPAKTVAKRYDFSLTNTAEDKAGNALATISSSFTTLRNISATFISEGERDGTVWKNGAVYTEGIYLEIGDNLNNVGMRGFVSFSLASIPEAAVAIEAAKLSLFKSLIVGSPYQNLEDCTPTCTITGASIMLDHLNYGDTLVAEAYSAASLENLGKFDDRFKSETGLVSMDVTASVEDDLANREARGNYSQYRLSFPVETNTDGKDDYVAFLATDRAANGFPTLVIDYITP